MAVQLTPDQLIDILIQSPDRVTAGILEQRSLWAKTRDSIMTRKNREMVDYRGGIKGTIQNARRAIFLEFDEAAKVPSEHPRSLRKAMLELKALGYNYKQIKDIKDDVSRFALSHFEHVKATKKLVAQNYPGYIYFWNDDAFLGIGINDLPEEVRSSGHLTLSKIDGAPTYNAAFTDETMEAGCEAFREYYKYTIKKHPDYLTPAHNSHLAQRTLQPK